MKTAIFALFAFLPLYMMAGVLDDKSPAYFADRYGQAKSSATVTSHAFTHPKSGSVPLKGEFSVRKFKEGDLSVRAVFALPSLKLATVRLQLPRRWTAEQVQAALAAYGDEWKPISRNGIVNAWVAPDGSMAINLLTWIDIQSKAVVDQLEQQLAEAEAQRKAIPKF